jgi:hypothetical protein
MVWHVERDSALALSFVHDCVKLLKQSKRAKYFLERFFVELDPFRERKNHLKKNRRPL